MQKRNKEENKEKNKKDAGTTMVSVIISFALLLLFVTGFFKIQRVSQNIMMDAKDVTVNSRELLKAYYLGETENKTAAGNARLTFLGDSGSFYIDASLNSAVKEGLTGTVYYYGSEDEEQE